MVMVKIGLGSLVATKIRSLRREEGVGFLEYECLVNEVDYINSVKYEESVWIKVRSVRRREALYIHTMLVYICHLRVQAFLLWIVLVRALEKTNLVLGRSLRLFHWVISMVEWVEV